MELTDAVDLIKIPFDHPETWADLGAGSGTFTRALALLLPAGSLIHAVDQNTGALQTIPDEEASVKIKKWTLDFDRQPLPFGLVDGILMANSLHFVLDKPAVLQKLKQQMKADQGRLLMVEYDTDNANPWVPYPISFSKLKDLCVQNGFSRVEKYNEYPSIYGRANMYAALIQI